jgi:hypothetical protein
MRTGSSIKFIGKNIGFIIVLNKHYLSNHKICFFIVKHFEEPEDFPSSSISEGHALLSRILV